MSGQIDITPATIRAAAPRSLAARQRHRRRPANWSGGTLALGGGFDAAGGGDFQTSGSSFKLIDTVFSNDAIATTFGGTGMISVGGTASAPWTTTSPAAS